MSILLPILILAVSAGPTPLASLQDPAPVVVTDGERAPGAAPSSGTDSPRATTTAGPVVGAWIEEQGRPRVARFLGIPYAAPPTGARRWAPPEPPETWHEPRPCLDFGAACPQPDLKLFDVPARQDEDCLHLNVWTTAPAAEARLPVMVFFHGGGFVTGAASLSTYDGAELARAGVVLVTANYRLGTFGFLAHPALSAESGSSASGTGGASGNWGLLDQIAALRWVQDNAASVGGDPERVTIFGESAGAASVCALMCSPLANGLFQRAIAQSGAPALALRTLEEAEAAGLELAEHLGVPGRGAAALVALRALPAEAILAARSEQVLLPGNAARGFLCVDGRVLTESPSACFEAGRQAKVPLLIGVNRDEGTIFAPLVLAPIAGLRGLAAALGASRDERFDELYPAGDADQASASLARLVSDGFALAARRTAGQHARIEPRTFTYRFSRVAPFFERVGKGAFHGLELTYVFGLREAARAWAVDQDLELSRAMLGYWSRFAAAGDPNPPAETVGASGARDPHWPAFTAEGLLSLELDVPIRVGTPLAAPGVDYLAGRR